MNSGVSFGPCCYPFVVSGLLLRAVSWVLVEMKALMTRLVEHDSSSESVGLASSLCKANDRLSACPVVGELSSIRRGNEG